MDRPTVHLYEARATEYERRRAHRSPAAAARFARRIPAGTVRMDAGCGPGIDLPALGTPVVALDASGAMLRLAHRREASALAVQADLERLPLRREVLGGVWARQSYLHLPRHELPMALAELHRACRVGAPLGLTMLAGPGDGWEPPENDFTGRFFAGWDEDALRRALVGAGFSELDIAGEGHKLVVSGVRSRTLPDTVGPSMRVLICGLNPSVHAADAGYGYAGPGNRFWRAATEAGMVEGPPDPFRALRDHGVGMTDLVKRPTPRAAQVSLQEYRDGARRVEELVRWLRPATICFVGLSGYRAAVDRAAQAGWQEEALGGVPTYVMPSTSGLNTRSRFEDLVGHLRAVLVGPGGG